MLPNYGVYLIAEFLIRASTCRRVYPQDLRARNLVSLSKNSREHFGTGHGYCSSIIIGNCHDTPGYPGTTVTLSLLSRPAILVLVSYMF